MDGKRKYEESWEDYQERLADEDRHYKMYHSANPFVKWIFNKRFEIVCNIIKNKPGLKLLDAGCGDGFFLEKIKDLDLSLYGIDISKKRIKRVSKLVPCAKLFQSRIESMPFKNNFFDIVVCSDVLEHIPNYSKAISDIVRVTKKDGMILIIFPNEWLWTICRTLLLRFPPKEPQHINSFSTKMINRLIGLHNNFEKNIPFKYFSLSKIVGYNVRM